MKQPLSTRCTFAALFLGLQCLAGAAHAAPFPDPGASAPVNNSAPVTLPRATTKTCSSLVDTIARQEGIPKDRWVLVDTSGHACYIPENLKQTAPVHFAAVAAAGEATPTAVTAEVTPDTDCPTPTSTLHVTGDVPPFALKARLAGDSPVPTYMPSANAIACQGDKASVDVSVIQRDGSTAKATTKLVLYGLTNGTVQLGVLSSRLGDTSYGLVSSGDHTVITDKSPQTRGPQYVATVVVQAFPKQVESLLPKHAAYYGRDMLHDNEWDDKVGLVFAFGIKDPTKRFGLGLSYELASGINVIGVHEWVNRSVLDGAKVGDTFAGAAADIPTRNEWARGWAIGLTFDMSYLTNIFKK